MHSFIFPCLQDKEPLGIIPLENLSVRKVEDPKKPVSTFSWYSANTGPKVVREKVPHTHTYRAPQREDVIWAALFPSPDTMGSKHDRV